MPCCGCLETSCLLLWSGSLCLWASASVFITEASSPHRWHHVSCLQAKDSDDDEEVVQVDRDHFMDEFFEQVRQRAQVTAGSHVTAGLNHELDTVRVVNSSWEHWDCSVWDKRLLRGRCLHRNKDTKVSWGRRDRKHRNKKCFGCDGASSGFRLHAISALKNISKSRQRSNDVQNHINL